jgi:SAM-dependent methyltransferase
MRLEEQQSQVTEYFSKEPANYAGEYGRETANGYSFRVRRERLIEMLGKGSGKVLDIGCGPAVMTREILDLGWGYDGVDISEAMIEEARGRFAGEPRANFAVGPVERIAAADGAYDAVVAMGLVEYLADDAVAIREMARVTKSGGRLLISLPNWWSPVRMWDRWILVPLARLVRAVLGRKRTELNVLHREYLPSGYRDLLKGDGLEPVRTVAYNFRVLPRPLDTWFPRLSVASAKAFELLRGTPLRFLATGVIVEAKKR